METAMTIVLSPLPYAQDALAPHISADTLATHHGKHHKAYVDKVNAAIEGTDLAGKSLEEIIHHAEGAGNKGLLDRKSVGEGKSVSVRVDLVGRRLIKKK